MPRLIRPATMPQEVQEIIETIGNHARAEILHDLATNGPATTPELRGRLGVGRSTINLHVTALEAAGLISADMPTGTRPGRTVRWTIDAARVDDHLKQLRHYFTGQ